MGLNKLDISIYSVSIPWEQIKIILGWVQ